ncbi:MAG TPA: MFS transporter [Gaiellaceae bacterium]|nr:MFS transporter [Gaiellaceae bacterium]
MTRLLEPLAAAAAAFRNRNLLRLELGWLGAITGEFAYAVAISVYAYRADGATAVGLVWLVRMIPSAIAAPVLSMIGDRFPRQRVMLVGNGVRFLATALSALGVWLDAPAVAIYALSVLVAIVSTAFWPAQAALLPVIARTPRELTAANTASSTLEGLGSFVGPAACGALLALTSIELAFATTALSFLCAAFLVARIEAPAAARAPVGGFSRIVGETFAGFRTIASDRRVAFIAGIYTAWAAASGALNVLVVVAAIELLSIGEGGVGVLNAAIGAGGVFGALAMLALAGTRRYGFVLAVGMLVWSLPIALVGVWPNTLAAVALLAALGVGNIIMDVAALTLVQRVVPDEVLTRVLGLIEGLWVGALGLGAAAVPLLIALVDARGALLATGLLLPLIALLSRGALRSIDEAPVVDEGRAALLRRIAVFSPLPPAALERLAASLHALRYEQGREIVTQGEPGDRFYVLTRGTVEVESDGRPIGTFGPGYFFGEIALIRRVPRTATVRAVTDVDVEALDRDEFLGAVTGHTPSAAAAEDVVSARLSSLGRLAMRRV